MSSTTRLFDIDASVAEIFPEIKIGFGIIRHVRVLAEHPELEVLKSEVIREVRENLGDRQITTLPRVQAFRQIYKKFGVNPNSRRPSAEALLRRIIDPGKDLYKVNTVVDAYNLVSAQYQLPMAAYDLDRLTLPIILRFAQEGELHRAIGQAMPEPLSAGELVYADQHTILCRDFNYRDADATKVTTETHNLIVFVDGCAEVESSQLLDALKMASMRIVAFNGGEIDGSWIFPSSALF
jgi:DNA/RNA-binding domain of Phe-tRNA-synthetase-like protein